MAGTKGSDGREYDVIVLGGGAAGLFCAAETARAGLRVAVLEHQPTVGRKIRISGGGRCNFTNRDVSPRNYISPNPRFCASALARSTPEDFIGLVDRHGIAWHEKKDGQLFCDGSAQRIVDMLVSECGEAGSRLFTGCGISSVSHDERFRLETSHGPFEVSRLVVATGGVSLPKLGATDFGYRIARQFGLDLVEPAAALVPLTWNVSDRERYRALAGVSLPVRISCGDVVFDDDLLFTHRGLSGPAVLQISSYWRPNEEIIVNFLPDADSLPSILKRARGAATVGTVLSRHLPRRLVETMLDGPVRATPVANCPRALHDEIGRILGRARFVPAGSEGFDKAEVTRGGVATRELSSKTMEAAKRPGLYFIGEVVDVTGWLGGYNFQWAWSSAAAAAVAVAAGRLA